MRPMTQDNARQPHDRTSYFRLGADEYRAVAEVAREEDRSVSYVIRLAVSEFLARRVPQAEPQLRRAGASHE